MNIKKYVKKIARYLFCKTIPVNVPVYEGELLKGRTALITGGTSGIGYSIAKAFLENGANVIIIGRTKDNVDRAVKKLEQSIKKEKNKIYGIEMDISEIDKIEQKFNDILNLIENKEIDILVNNAGILIGKNIGETSIEDYEKLLKTNLEGPYFLSQVVCNYMKDKKIKGNILNILSSSSLRPAVKPYTLSKWGLRGLTVGMAKKFIPFGIVVNGIAPGPTATPMLIKEHSNDGIDLETSPIGRYILPQEIANLAVFMVSSMGRAIVGDIVYMTGGAGTITVDDINY